MIAYQDLLELLQAEVPAQNGAPTEAQYEAALRKAVSDFSRRAGPLKRTTISIVANTASYTLPDDFLEDIRMEMPVVGETYVPPGGQLIPLGTAFQEEQYAISGTTITFYPTPQYTMDRVLWYRAAHVLNESQQYPDMTGEQADIVLLKARAECFRYLHMNAAPDGWRYSIGDVTVDKSGQARSLREVSADLNQEYMDRVEEYIGAVGTQALFTSVEQTQFLDY